LGYSAKNAKQILEKKIQEEHLRAEEEKRRLAEEKEKISKKLAREKENLLQEKRRKQQLERKINHLSTLVIEAALTDKDFDYVLDKKVNADLALRGELTRRGFIFDRMAETKDPDEKDYLPQAKEMLQALVEIEKLALYTADQVEQVEKKYNNEYIVLSLKQWKEINTVIDGEFSKKFNKNNLKFTDYSALCKKFNEIQDLSIFDYDYFDELEFSDYSKEISPSENIKRIIYDLQVNEVSAQIKLGELILRWKIPGRTSEIYKDDFFTAEKVNWLTSPSATKFIEKILDKIEEQASNKNNSMQLYLIGYDDEDCEVSQDNKSFIPFPYSLSSLLDLFKKLGYQIKDKKFKECEDETSGSVLIVWS